MTEGWIPAFARRLRASSAACSRPACCRQVLLYHLYPCRRACACLQQAGRNDEMPVVTAVVISACPRQASTMKKGTGNVKQASRKHKQGKPLSDRVLRSIQEALGIALCILALYLLIALITYHPADPAWSHSVTADTIHNSAGVWGARISCCLSWVIPPF